MSNTSSTTSSTTSSQKTSKCNSCSQNGLYFSFGKKLDNKRYALIKGKQRRVYRDSKGRYYKENSKKKYLKKGTRTNTVGPTGQKRHYKKDHYLKKHKSLNTKIVKDKKKRFVGYRLSARSVFNKMGRKAVGKSFNILQKDGTYKKKYLRIRYNGSPYFANKFGDTLQLNIPYNHNWLRGHNPSKMTGIKYSWPNKGYNIAPSGVEQPLLNKVSSLVKRENKYGDAINIPHMHYGKMCFGA